MSVSFTLIVSLNPIWHNFLLPRELIPSCWHPFKHFLLGLSLGGHKRFLQGCWGSSGSCGVPGVYFQAG